MNSLNIQNLPQGWTLIRLKWILAALESGRREVSDTDSFSDGVLSVGGEHVGWQGQWLLENPRFVSREFYEAMASGRIREGDILLVKDGATIGKVAIARPMPAEEAAVNEHVFLLRVAPHNDHKYWFYVVQSSLTQEQIRLEVRGSAQPGLNSDFRNMIIVPKPPLSQQRVIADYLDRETARIDALIAAKERLLGLLAEKRRALITRAVTRGLDPHVPLRDSGIPWLGEIPWHWQRAQFRRFIQFITSGSRGWAEHYSNSGAIFVRIGNLTRDSVFLDLSDLQHVEPPEGAEGERTRVRVNDLLFSITAYLGSVAIVDQDIGEAYVNQHIALVRLDESGGLLAWYAACAALSSVGQAQLVAQSYGGTKIQLALDDIRELWFPIPPLDEQRAIVEHIVRETAKLDAVRAATERSVALLKERRAALIAAAVTGEIEVRS